MILHRLQVICAIFMAATRLGDPGVAHSIAPYTTDVTADFCPSHKVTVEFCQTHRVMEVFPVRSRSHSQILGSHK